MCSRFTGGGHWLWHPETQGSYRRHRSVSAAQIEKIPVVTVDQALQGRAAGVQIVNNDGAPGGNISVLISGIGSIGMGGNPAICN